MQEDLGLDLDKKEEKKKRKERALLQEVDFVLDKCVEVVFKNIKNHTHGQGRSLFCASTDVLTFTQREGEGEKQNEEEEEGAKGRNEARQRQTPADMDGRCKEKKRKKSNATCRSDP